MPKKENDDSIAHGGCGSCSNEQDREERRQIRVRYRELMQDFSTNRSELVGGSTLLLKAKIDTTNELFEQVTHCREAVLDAQCVASIANLGKQKIQALPTGFDNFSIIEFVAKLKERLGCLNNTTEDDETDATSGMTGDNWITLGCACQSFFKRSPPLSLMYGSFDPGSQSQLAPKTRTPRAPKVNLDKQQNVVPESTQGPGRNGGDPQGKTEETTAEVERIYSLLKRVYRGNDENPLCYFEFVVNPDSFSQTIENVFYTSFLVKDNHARLFLDEDDLPVIEPVTDRDATADGVEPGDGHQMIMPWTVDGWRQIKDSFNIQRPVIPHRPSVQPGSGGSRSGTQ